MIERIPTRIKGFDELIEGGFPRKSNILVCGTPGSGKTIFGLQFLYNGALDGEKGIFVSFVDPRDKIIKTSLRFRWSIERLEKEGKIKIIEVSPEKPYRALEFIESEIEKFGAERVVFDTFTVLSLYAGVESIGIVATEMDRRREITNLVRYINKFETTNVLISESPEEGRYSRDGIIEFLVDGIVILYNFGVGERSFRTLSIPKMKYTNQSRGVYPFEIIDMEGIVVYKNHEEMRIEL